MTKKKKHTINILLMTEYYNNVTFLELRSYYVEISEAFFIIETLLTNICADIVKVTGELPTYENANKLSLYGDIYTPAYANKLKNEYDNIKKDKYHILKIFFEICKSVATKYEIKLKDTVEKLTLIYKTQINTYTNSDDSN